MTGRLLTAYQVADILGRPRPQVQAWIESGRLASQRLPDGDIRISEKQLLRFLRQEGIDIAAMMVQTVQAKRQVQAPEPARPHSVRPDGSYQSVPATTSLQPRMALAAATPAAPPDQALDEDSYESDAPADPPPVDAPPPEPPEGEDQTESPDETDASVAPNDTPVDQPAGPDEPPVDQDTAGPGAGQVPAEQAAEADQAPAEQAPEVVSDVEQDPDARADVDESPAAPDDEPDDRAPEVRPEPAAEPEGEPTGPAPAPIASKPRPERPQATPTDPARAARQIAEAIVADAAARGASAIHLQASGDEMTLRLRLGGVLAERTNFKRNLPEELAPKLFDEFRSLAGLGGQARGHQRGGFEMTVSGRTIALAVSALPTVDGQELVLRLSDTAAVGKGLTGLGMTDADARAIEDMLDRPYGLIVVAGPPRQGTAETLGAMTARQADGRRSVLAIRRVAGAALPNITQCLCGGREGMDWGEALWAARDHDCDVVAVEDVGDPPTAAAAVESALAGQMVLAGMRAISSIEAIRLLVRMGAKPWPLASTLLGVVARRTVRTLCPDCRTPDPPARQDLVALGLTPRDVDFETFVPRGCENCRHTGYRGQAVLTAVWPADEALADAIRDGATAAALVAAATQSETPDLLSAGLARARQGQVALADLARAAVRRCAAERVRSPRA